MPTQLTIKKKMSKGTLFIDKVLKLRDHATFDICNGYRVTSMKRMVNFASGINFSRDTDIRI